MLKLKNITKTYSTNSYNQTALDNISINFRKSEFASVLGQSGSGKTTLLNIIGGLDVYDSGDLSINGISTKDYKDRDWDTYRNHRVGFIFQSYNLISHQSVLKNVEMALTLSGVGKKERHKRAIEALERVGLKDHIYKKPNQLSGGQMQRVAIARALINDPDIILADEPTGALDSDTAVQIMEILKEISDDKLIIMVTHNPELAETYSTRIISLKDGIITGDTNPYDGEEITEDTAKTKHKNKKTSMSLKTAISLSFRNLMSKKGRTILTAFAGSIGIIGIALILSISTGVNNYIDSIQQDTLSSYPISILEETTDMSSLMTTMMGVAPEGENTEKHDNDAVYANPIMYRMMKSMLNAEVETNNLTDFKAFLDENKNELNEYATAIKYGYNTDLNIYAIDPNGEYAKADFYDLMGDILGAGDNSFTGSITSYIENMGAINIWQELIMDSKSGEVSEMITDQYDLLYGSWPNKANEVLLVLTNNNEISDLTLYALGLVGEDVMMESTMAAMTGKEDNSFDEIIGKSWNYEEICNIPLKLILPTDYYRYDESKELWVDISDNQALLNSVIDKGFELKVSGIVKPAEGVTATALTSSLCYTPALTEYYIKSVNESEIIKEQKENPDYNIISGLPFILDEQDDVLENEKPDAFKDYVKELNTTDKANLYKDILSNPDEEVINNAIDTLIGQYKDKTAEDIVKDIVDNYSAQLGYSGELITGMLSGYEKDELIDLLTSTVREMLIAKYEEDAENTIKSIQNSPSDEEIAVIKNNILSEVYISVAGLSGIARDMAVKQINIGLISQNWVNSMGVSQEFATSYLNSLPSDELDKLFNNVINDMAIETYAQYSGMSMGSDSVKKVADAFDKYLEGCSDEDLIYYYNNNMPSKISDLTYNELLESIGVCDLNSPSSINIYPIDFEMKENIASMIEEYNNSAKEEDKITYTDYMAMIMSSVSNIIDAISVVLICFVSISLIVSSIMIGIITYISVLERTKEIGILRAVGASKKDISHVFNAETAIVGFFAGVVGVVLTVILCVPINLIARSVTGIASLTAVLPWYGYLLIVLSILLTLIAGLFPAGIAAKNNLVESLRSE